MAEDKNISDFCLELIVVMKAADIPILPDCEDL